MKIEYTKKKISKNIHALKMGDVFKRPGGETPYIVTDGGLSGQPMAINLLSGQECPANVFNEVVVMDAKLVIET